MPTDPRAALALSAIFLYPMLLALEAEDLLGPPVVTSRPRDIGPPPPSPNVGMQRNTKSRRRGIGITRSQRNPRR